MSYRYSFRLIALALRGLTCDGAHRGPGASWKTSENG